MECFYCSSNANRCEETNKSNVFCNASCQTNYYSMIGNEFTKYYLQNKDTFWLLIKQKPPGIRLLVRMLQGLDEGDRQRVLTWLIAPDSPAPQIYTKDFIYDLLTNSGELKVYNIIFSILNVYQQNPNWKHGYKRRILNDVFNAISQKDYNVLEKVLKQIYSTEDDIVVFEILSMLKKYVFKSNGLLVNIVIRYIPKKNDLDSVLQKWVKESFQEFVERSVNMKDFDIFYTLVNNDNFDPSSFDANKWLTFFLDTYLDSKYNNFIRELAKFVSKDRLREIIDTRIKEQNKQELYRDEFKKYPLTDAFQRVIKIEEARSMNYIEKTKILEQVYSTK